MTRPNEYRAYFTLTGEFDPAEITSVLGLQPTNAWMKGERNEKTHYERKFSRWSLESKLGPSASLESQVDDVLDQMTSAKDAVVQLRETLTGYMQLVGYFHSDYPGMSFEASTIAKLAEFKLGMDCDFYYMYSDRREDS